MVFPHIELTPVSLAKRHLHIHMGNSGEGDARYDYDSRDFRVARRIRRRLPPAHPYDSLTYFGLANN